VGALAGICAVLSQQPYAIWPLIFIALICFVYLLDSYRVYRDNRHRISFCLGWGIYSAGMCSWISYFGTMALVAFVIFEVLLAFIFVSITARIAWRMPRSIAYAFMWVAFEWALSHFPVLSFSWLSISTTMVGVAPIRIFARVGGGALITFLIVIISSIIAIYIRDRRTHSSTVSNRLRIFTALGACVGLIILACLANVSFGVKPSSVSISVVQGNDKNRYLTYEEVVDHYLEKSHLSLAQSIKGHRDIIVFPESAFDTNPETDPYLNSSLVPIAKKASRVMILNTITQKSSHNVNRNYFYSPSMKLLGHYDKKRLVPFGEYIPLKKYIGSWTMFDRIGPGFAPGHKDTTINNVTTLICYESTFTDDVHRALNKNSRLLVITTNNRSYRRSGNSDQHLAQTQLRAAEYGISIVQASVSGKSALIERDGSIVKHTKLFERTVLSGRLSFGRPDSIYSRTGDWLSLCALVIVGYLSLIQLRKNRWKNQTSTK